MKVRSFKFDEQFTVEYENNGDTIRVKTSDRPQNELYTAALNVLKAVTVLFDTDFSPCSLYSITFSWGDLLALQKSKIVIEKPIQGYDPIKIAFPDVIGKDMVDITTGEITEHPRNDYNVAVFEFAERIEEYAKGKRQQLDLGFEDVEEGNGEEREVADKVLQFN